MAEKELADDNPTSYFVIFLFAVYLVHFTLQRSFLEGE